MSAFSDGVGVGPKPVTSRSEKAMSATNQERAASSRSKATTRPPSQLTLSSSKSPCTTPHASEVRGRRAMRSITAAQASSARSSPGNVVRTSASSANPSGRRVATRPGRRFPAACRPASAAPHASARAAVRASLSARAPGAASTSMASISPSGVSTSSVSVPRREGRGRATCPPARNSASASSATGRRPAPGRCSAGTKRRKLRSRRPGPAAGTTKTWQALDRQNCAVPRSMSHCAATASATGLRPAASTVRARRASCASGIIETQPGRGRARLHPSSRATVRRRATAGACRAQDAFRRAGISGAGAGPGTSPRGCAGTRA